MVPVLILLEEKDLTQIITEECVTENSDNGFAGEGLGVLKTNQQTKCVWGTG